jgi:hypothetical protein
VRFDSRDLIVRVTPETGLPAIYACQVCDSTAGKPRPQPAPCPAPSRCQDLSVEPPAKRAAELGATGLSLLRGQLRDSLSRQ